MKLIAYIALVSWSACAGTLPAPLVPDSSETPGVVCLTNDKDFREFRYAEKIPYCTRNVTTAQKNKIYHSYGVPPKCRAEYTIDHFFPLSLGGNNSRGNLWPEHKAVKKIRQNLEVQLYIKLKNGHIRQEEALRTIEDAKLHPNVDAIATGFYCDLVPGK